MTNSIGSTLPVTQSQAQPPNTQPTAAQQKQKQQEQQDTVQLSQQAQQSQKAGDVDHDGDNH